MMKFVYQDNKNEKTPVTTMEVKNPNADLEEVMTSFEQFLRGCGYSFDGHVEINTEAQ